MEQQCLGLELWKNVLHYQARMAHWTQANIVWLETTFAHWLASTRSLYIIHLSHFWNNFHNSRTQSHLIELHIYMLHWEEWKMQYAQLKCSHQPKLNPHCHDGPAEIYICVSGFTYIYTKTTVLILASESVLIPASELLLDIIAQFWWPYFWDLSQRTWHHIEGNSRAVAISGEHSIDGGFLGNYCSSKIGGRADWYMHQLHTTHKDQAWSLTWTQQWAVPSNSPIHLSYAQSTW